jgi:hypothetical protein
MIQGPRLFMVTPYQTIKLNEKHFNMFVLSS